MKVTIEVDCTPEEARRYMGLPDVTALNDHFLEQVKLRMEGNLKGLPAEELMKSWMAFGQGAQDQFRQIMEASARNAANFTK
ncbi:DUF6489 family protein [Phenylobacterium immobile]|uniref:DUF6489 family protein n=1 Tax=Phenylobacterium immobile TaxID=21 RepID=UPI000AD8A748|nr:DUF6489 family protein [Phenylobacterium immobile]